MSWQMATTEAGVTWFVDDETGTAWLLVSWTDDPAGDHAIATIEHPGTRKRVSLGLAAEPHR